VIDVRSLSHAYLDGTPKVLDDVEVTFPPGQVTALVGSNGAGKSTLLSAMGRLLTPKAGSVLLDGVDIAKAPPTTVAKRMAVLRQDNRISARLTVVDLIRFGRFPYSAGRLTPQDHSVVEQALDYVDMTAMRDCFLDELSGGQRQRAYIAMILAQDTDYVLLDEPLNNLDMRHAAAIMQLLRRTADDLERTVIVVLHDINVASSYCDRIVGMRDGRIVVDGTPAHVMRTDVLAEVFDMQIPVHDIDGHRLALHWAPERHVSHLTDPRRPA
jgi:iron complex transport system ATP-binding protein